MISRDESLDKQDINYPETSLWDVDKKTLFWDVVVGRRFVTSL